MFQDKYLKYKAKYLELKNSIKKLEQKGGNKKNISTWGGQLPDNNNKNITKKPKKPISEWN